MHCTVAQPPLLISGWFRNSLVLASKPHDHCRMIGHFFVEPNIREKFAGRNLLVRVTNNFDLNSPPDGLTTFLQVGDVDYIVGNRHEADATK